jgi:hypothetical protein
MSANSTIHDERAVSGKNLRQAIALDVDLPDDLRVLWETFSHLWRDGRRREAYDFLPALLAAWKDCDEKVRRRFAQACCRIAFTAETTFPLARRLLVEVMLPYLGHAIGENIMPDMIWVVEAKRQLYEGFIDEHIGPVSNFDLLKKALELEPNHPRAARLLLDDLMYTLECNSQDMPERYLCADEEIERTLQLLAQALDIAAAGATSEERIFFVKHKRLFEAWRKFQAVSPDVDFAEWCRRSGVCLP